MSKPVSSIAPHTFIKGDIRLDGPGVIGGHVQGSIASADALEIGAEAIIDGNIEGVLVVIHGTVKGNVVATQACRLGATARVAGDVCTADLAIAKGARFIGQACVGDDVTGAIPEVPAASAGGRMAVEAAEARAQAAEEREAIQVVEATINRIERTAARVEAAVPSVQTMSIPTMPSVQVLTQNVQGALQRAPRIIKAR